MNIKARAISGLKALRPLTPFWNREIEEAPPVPEEANEGARAAERGEPATSNPYAPGTKQHEDWSWGHDETCYRIEYDSTIED